MSIPNPFWNSSERRLRAAWRLLLQTVILAIALLLLGLALTLAFLFADGSAFRQFLADPRSGAALVEAMTGSWWYLLLTSFGSLLAIVLSVWLAGHVLDRRPFRDFGFRLGGQWWRDLAFGLGLGAFLMTVVFLVEWAAGWVTISSTFSTPSPDGSFLAAILLALANFLFVGIREEVLSRGYHLRNLAEGLNWRWWNPRVALLLGWLVSSGVFGLLHAANPNASAVSTANLVLAGLLLGFGFILTGELAIAIGLLLRRERVRLPGQRPHRYAVRHRHRAGRAGAVDRRGFRAGSGTAQCGYLDNGPVHDLVVGAADPRPSRAGRAPSAVSAKYQQGWPGSRSGQQSEPVRDI